MSRSNSLPPTPDPLERQLASLTAPAPSPALRERLRSLPQRDPLPPRRPSRRPLALATGLAVALLVAALVGTLPTRHQVAFADVQRSMQSVKTASWRYTFVQCDPEGHPVVQSTEREWVRLDPATQISRTTIAAVRDRSVKPTFIESLQDGRINVYHTLGNSPGTDLYDVRPYGGGSSLRKNILDSLTFTQQTYDNTPYYKEGAWRTQHIAFEGQQVLQFRRDFFDGKKYDGTDTVLVDPGTDRFIRAEMRQVNPMTGLLNIVITNDQYRYNDAVPAATFDIAPPPGKTVTIQDERPDSALTFDEQRQIKATVDRSNSAYRAGDFARFAALWDFDYHQTLPKMAQRYPNDSYRQFWKAQIAVQKQKGAQEPGRLLEPLTLLPAPYAYTRHSATDPFPPSTPRGLIRVKATWKFVRRNGTLTQHPVIYDLRRETGGYKIYQWYETTWGKPD